jgi:hypothetical protein
MIKFMKEVFCEKAIEFNSISFLVIFPQTDPVHTQEFKTQFEVCVPVQISLLSF